MMKTDMDEALEARRDLARLRPAGEADFLRWLDWADCEEKLFSRLGYWFTFRGDPEAQNEHLHLVEERAKELKLWNGLELKLRRWQDSVADEYQKLGRDEFASRIGEDYADYCSALPDAGAPAAPPPGPACMQDVPLLNVHWLVPGLLPLGEVSLLGADGGTGKGIWQAQLIAAVTTGKTSGFFPTLPPETGRVLIFSGEDDPSRVLKARLMAAGADMSRVMVMTADAWYARTGNPLCLPDKAFAEQVEKASPRLVIVDPLQSFLPAKVEMASRNQMRGALLPLKALCARLGCAALISMHTNKRQHVSGRNRLADSSDIWDIARSVLMMGRDRTSGQLYLSHEKSSYARPADTALLHIEGVRVEDIQTARAVFDGRTEKKDSDFMEGRRSGPPAQTKDDTAAAILNVLAESRLGSLPSNQLRTEVLREIGCSERTYNRAYGELVKAGEITKRQITQKSGERSWYSFLSDSSKLDGKVGNI